MSFDCREQAQRSASGAQVDSCNEESVQGSPHKSDTASPSSSASSSDDHDDRDANGGDESSASAASDFESPVADASVDTSADAHGGTPADTGAGAAASPGPRQQQRLRRRQRRRGCGDSGRVRARKSEPPPSACVRHPAFPDLPADVPLTYALTMHACLCALPADRPSFRDVVTLLDDTRAEVAAGSYLNLEGLRRVLFSLNLFIYC
jgi:hypothetical protein